MLRWLLVLGALLLAACAPFHKPLTAEARSRIKQVDAQIVVAQDTFMFSAQAPGISAATGGGLIPALIDAAVQQSRQKELASQIEQVVGPLMDVDYRIEAGRALDPQARSGFPLDLARVDVVAAMPVKRDHDARIAATSDGSTYMLMWVNYELALDISAFTTRTTTQIWQGGQPDPVYRIGTIYQSRLPGGEQKAMVQRLAANDGARLRALMHESMYETWKMIGLDLAVPANQAATFKPSASRPLLWFNGQWLPLPEVTLLQETSARQYLRSAQGVLLSLGVEATP